MRKDSDAQKLIKKSVVGIIVSGLGMLSCAHAHTEVSSA